MEIFPDLGIYHLIYLQMRGSFIELYMVFNHRKQSSDE